MKRKVLKILSVIIAFSILLLSGCRNNVANDDFIPVQKIKRKLTIAINDNISLEGLKTVKTFCDKAEEISEGSLIINYKISEDALNDFYNGADFIFAPNNIIARADANFTSYVSPFYFKNFNHAMLTLNSKKFLNLTSDITQSLLNANQLGCFYDGAYFIVSSKVNELGTVNKYNELRIHGTFDYTDEFLLESLGINTVNKSNNELAEKFNSASIHTMLCKSETIKNLILPKGREEIFFYDCYFKADYNWLFISDSLEKDLDDNTMAVICEATAYAMGENNNSVLKNENEAIESLKKLNVKEIPFDYEEYYNYTSKLFESSPKFKFSWDLENHKAVRLLTDF